LKDRITLAVLILFLWIFLFIFQKYLPLQSSIFILVGFMVFYALLLHAAQSHQKRNMKKKPPVIDDKYEPFVSILIPAHNEENVIAKTIENII